MIINYLLKPGMKTHYYQLAKYMACSNSIDLLVLDVIMPKKNGKEAYDEVRRQRPGMKAMLKKGIQRRIILWNHPRWNHSRAGAGH
jgi:DNA-binding response OmpR family regulator